MLLRCPRFGVSEFDFENCAPRHLRNARRNKTCCERNFVWNIVLWKFVVPFRAAEICGDRLIVLCIQKRVGRVSRNRQQDGYRYNPDSVHAHTTIKKRRKLARCYFPALRITTAEISLTLTKPSKNSAPVRWERRTRLSLTCSTLPPIFSPECMRSSTVLPVFPCRTLRMVALG